MTTAEYGLWAGLRADPVELIPHPEPTQRGILGDWLSEYAITSWPPAPPGWTLRQLLAEGRGIHSRTGKPTSLVKSLALAYLHRSTARGATAVLHLKRGVKTAGGDAWRFAVGYRWDLCVEIDCDHDRNHLTADLLREAGAEEIQALLNEGTT